MPRDSFNFSRTPTRAAAIMYRPVLQFSLLLLVTGSSLSQNRTLAKNTQWFEGQIDEFIRNAQDTGEPTDIQVSTCKISSQQLVATAQATAARVLKGICNPAELEDRFSNLETQLGDQLNVLKSMLLSLEDKIVELDQELRRNHRRSMTLLASGVRRDGTGTGSTVIDENTYAPAYIPSIPHRAQEVISEDDDVGVRGGGGTRATDDDFGSIDLKSGHVGPRANEVGKYNTTIHIEQGRRVFTYYWIVTGMQYKLQNWNQQRVLRSNSFYIYERGYRMYIKLIPKYSPSTMFLHVGITKGDYDQGLDWPFTQRMRVYVLDQTETPGRAQDLKSRMWDPKELCSGSNWVKPVVGDNPECVGLGIPHDVIKTRQYIWSDRIVIKLNVYLD